MSASLAFQHTVYKPKDKVATKCAHSKEGVSTDGHKILASY